MPSFGEGMTDGLQTGLMFRMMDTSTEGKRKLGILAGQPPENPLMRRLMNMAALLEMNRQPSPKNNWGLGEIFNSFRGVPTEGGTGLLDFLGSVMGRSVPNAGGGAPEGMPGPESPEWGYL